MFNYEVHSTGKDEKPTAEKRAIRSWLLTSDIARSPFSWVISCYKSKHEKALIYASLDTILLSSSNVLLITWWISCVHICAMSDDAITNRKIIAECQVSGATNNNIVSFRQRKAWTYSTFRVIEIKLQLISSSFYVISEMLTRRKLQRNSRSSHVSLFYSLR